MSTNTKTTRREVLGLLTLGSIGVTIGCGGGSNAPSGESRKAPVRLTISWPPVSKSRYLPTYAASLFFELYPKSDPTKRSSLVVNRPTGLPLEQDVSFAGLFVEGEYVLAGAARVQVDGQGASVATGLVSVTVRTGMAPVALTLGSTLGHLEIIGQPLQATIGVKLSLISGAFDPDNRSLLLPSSALIWSVVSGGTSGTITPTGELTPTAVGTVRVRVAEPRAGVSADADVAVIAHPVVVTLAATGWPKDSGDLANTGRSSGQGATGHEKWVFDFGAPPAGQTASLRFFGVPVIGSGLIYASDQYGQTVAVRATDGTAAWRVTPAFVRSVTPLLLSDNTLCCGGSGGLFGLDGLTGLEKWHNASANVSSLGFDLQKRVVVSGSSGLSFHNPNTGAIVGSGVNASSPGPVAVGPDGTLYYVARNSSNYELRASNPTTGALRWSFPLSFYSNSNTPVVASDGTVYFFGIKNDGTSFTYLFALDGTTGAVRAERQMNGTQIALGAGDAIFSASSKLTALSSALTVLWEKPLDPLKDGNYAPVNRLVIGGDGTLYISTEGNYVNAPNYLAAFIGAEGTQKWRYEYIGRNFGELALGNDGTIYFVANSSPVQDGTESIAKMYAIA